MVVVFQGQIEVVSVENGDPMLPTLLGVGVVETAVSGVARNMVERHLETSFRFLEGFAQKRDLTMMGGDVPRVEHDQVHLRALAAPEIRFGALGKVAEVERSTTFGLAESSSNFVISDG